MKEEALKLADELLRDNTQLTVEASDMIRKLVAELDKQGEPDYFGLTNDHTWISIDKKRYDKLDPDYRMACYTAPQTKPLSDEEIENLLSQSIWALGLNTDWTEDENWADAITVFRAIIERHKGKENE